jgi:hypothetical protein
MFDCRFSFLKFQISFLNISWNAMPNLKADIFKFFKKKNLGASLQTANVAAKNAQKSLKKNLSPNYVDCLQGDQMRL